MQNSQPTIQRLHEAAQQRRLERAQNGESELPRGHKKRRRQYKTSIAQVMETKKDEVVSTSPSPSSTVVIKENVTV